MRYLKPSRSQHVRDKVNEIFARNSSLTLSQHFALTSVTLITACFAIP
jgi:hypothetical protein